MALVLESPVAQFTEPVEEDGASERVAGLTLVEDAAGTASLLGIVEPVEHEQGALDPPDFTQCAGDGVLARIAGELAQHHRCADGASTDRGSKPQRLVSVLLGGANIDRAGDERAQRRPGCEVALGVEAAFAEVADSGREAEAEEMAQAENVIDGAGGIGRMLADRDPAFMVEQPVDDVRSLAGIGGDDLAVEGRETVGDMALEQYARLAAVAGVVIGARLATSARTKELPVRRGGVAWSPQPTERMSMVIVDDRGERAGIGFVADMPFGGPQQPGMGRPARAFRHAGQAEIGAISEDRAHQRGLGARRHAGAGMDEAIGEAGPGRDSGQQVGDPDARQQP